MSVCSRRARAAVKAFSLSVSRRDKREFSASVWECRLQRALVIVHEEEFLPRLRGVGLQFDNPLVGTVGVIDQNLVGLAQGAGIGCLLRQLALEVGDFGALGDNFAGEFRLLRVEPARGLLHQAQLPAKLLPGVFQFRRALSERAVVAAHGVVTGAKLGKHVAQAEIIGFFLFERMQCRPDGLHEVAEGLLEIVERADATIGIDQRLPSVSLSSPTRAPMSAKVASTGSSARRTDLATAGTAYTVDVDGTLLRPRRSEIVRMASPQTWQDLRAYTDFCNPPQSGHQAAG